MMRRFPMLCVLIASAALAGALASCSDSGHPDKADGLAVGGDAMPPDGFLDGWQRMGDAMSFRSDALYGRIDGGAEIFLELGFEQLDVQEYRREGKEIGIDVYRMADPAAALGIYLMKCGNETPQADFAERHTVNEYQLQFRKGSIYGVANRLDGSPGSEAELVAFARHVAANLTAGGGADPFEALPAKDRISGTERVIRGPFTLQAVYTLGDGDILKLRREGEGHHTTAVAADYVDGVEGDGAGGSFTRIVAVYGEEAAARAAFESVRDNLDPYLGVTASTNDSLDFKDYAGKLGMVRFEGARLDVTVNKAP